MTSPMQSEIVILTKSSGPLTKSIMLDGDGRLKSDGSACVMPSGRARAAAGLRRH
jgi:hypothetical protein